MRLANLAALHLEKNVIRIGGPEPTYHLVIPPEDVKNDEPLEYPLPKVVSEMLELYLACFGHACVAVIPLGSSLVSVFDTRPRAR